MITNTTRRPSMLSVSSAVAAALAAFALTACGPSDDATPYAGGSAATAAPAATPMTGMQVPVTSPAAAPQQAPTAPAYAAAPPVVVSQAGAQSTAAVPSGYAPQPVYAPAPQPTRVVEERQVDRSRIGSVQAIEPIHERPQGSGAGAVIGGVLGAVVGNQFGSGGGRAAMTGLGAVGGAVAGNNVERNHREAIVGYRVSIRLDNGGTRTFERSQVGGLQVGDRVRLDANSFRRV